MLNRLMMITALAALLAGCGNERPAPTPPPVVIRVPVPQPCAGTRPAEVPSLKARTPDWAALDVRQKAAALGQAYLEERTAREKLNAATAACP